MKTEIPAMEKSKIPTRREMMLQTYGPGPRPCVDGAANWLCCDPHCDQSCILSAGHQLDKDVVEKRLARLQAQREEHKQRFVKRGRMIRVKAASS